MEDDYLGGIHPWAICRRHPQQLGDEGLGLERRSLQCTIAFILGASFPFQLLARASAQLNPWKVFHQGLYILSRGCKEEGSLSIHLGSSLSSKHGCLLRFVVVVTAQIFPKPKFPVSHASLTFTSPCSSGLWLILSVFSFGPLNSILPIDIASWFWFLGTRNSDWLGDKCWKRKRKEGKLNYRILRITYTSLGMKKYLFNSIWQWQWIGFNSSPNSSLF